VVKTLKYILVLLISILISDIAISSTNFNDRIEQYQLKNGLKIILISDNRSPIVMSSVWYKVGSSYEYEGITGISHILEHMMFKGTENTKPGEFSREIKKIGGTENAFTGKDFTGYYQKVHKDYIELCLKLESDRMINLNLSENDLKSEREVVKEERRLRTEDNPISKIFEKIGLQIFGFNGYGIPIIGTMDDINAITIEDLKKWYSNYYVPNNATLIIAGSFNKKETKKLIQKYYGKIERKSVKKFSKKDTLQTSYKDILLKDNVSDPILVLSFRKEPFTNINRKESYALEILFELMDGAYSSRFTTNLVDKQIAFNTFISYDTYSKENNLVAIGGSPRENVSVDELKRLIIKEFDNFIKKGLKDNELEYTKSRLIAHNVYKFDSIFYQAMQVGVLETKGFNWQLLDQYIIDIESITEQDLINVAKKYIVEDYILTSIINPL